MVGHDNANTLVMRMGNQFLYLRFPSEQLHINQIRVSAVNDGFVQLYIGCCTDFQFPAFLLTAEGRKNRHFRHSFTKHLQHRYRLFTALHLFKPVHTPFYHIYRNTL